MSRKLPDLPPAVIRAFEREWRCGRKQIDEEPRKIHVLSEGHKANPFSALLYF